MDEFKKLPVKNVTNSPQSFGQGKMLPSEAITHVRRMLSAYPDSATCSTDYIATLTDVLCNFPRTIAVAACSPIHGIPKECKSFRPTAPQLAEWCENRIEAASSSIGAAKVHDAVQETLDRRKKYDATTMLARMGHILAQVEAGKMTVRCLLSKREVEHAVRKGKISADFAQRYETAREARRP